MDVFTARSVRLILGGGGGLMLLRVVARAADVVPKAPVQAVIDVLVRVVLDVVVPVEAAAWRSEQGASADERAQARSARLRGCVRALKTWHVPSWAPMA